MFNENDDQYVYVPNYLVPNIILCVIGCLLPAIVGVVFSILALSDKRKGDYDAASQHAEKAKTWMIVTIVLSALAWFGWLGNHLK